MPVTYREIFNSRVIVIYFRTVVVSGFACFDLEIPRAYAVGPPMGYDQWTTVVGTGAQAGQAVIQNTAGNECATGTFTCSVIAEDDGWRYELIATDTGEQYTRMIMTEAAADGGLGAGGVGGDPTAGIGAGNELAFTTETYTPMRGGTTADFVYAPDQTTLGLVAQGIAARQEIQSTVTGGDFVSTAEIQRGFARGVQATNEALGIKDGGSTPSDPFLAECGFVGDWNAGPGGPTPAQIMCAEALGEQAWDIKLTQTVSDPANGMQSGFSNVIYNELPDVSTRGVNTNIVRGRVTDVWQDVTDTASGQAVKFDYRAREGRTGFKWYCGMGVVCGPYLVTKGGSLTLDGTTVSWNATDEVSVAWIGSDLSPMFYTRVSTATDTAVDQLFAPGIPASWPAATDADLNWPLEPYVSDPFAASAPRTLPPAFP